MNLVLLGPPASGKGTCSEYLTSKYNFHHISMGNLLRDFAKSNSPLAKMVGETISKGYILDQELTSEILFDYLKVHNIYDNILLDGYPRGLKSCQLLEEFLKIDKVLVINADIEVLKSRILNRAICSSCGKVFALDKYSNMTCDECGEQLVKRKDDNIESFMTRLEEYKNLTQPVIDYYRNIDLVYDVDTTLGFNPKKIDEFMETVK